MCLGKGGERQYSGLVDVYRQTMASDGVQGLYRGFAISAVGIFIYRGEISFNLILYRRPFTWNSRQFRMSHLWPSFNQCCI